MSERFTTPVGRFVQGDCFVPQTKDQSGRPRVVKSGPNAGQPNPQYFVALAIPKTPGVANWWDEPHEFFQTVLRVGQTSFPQGQSQRPNFAWKIIDGDSGAVNQSGRVINTIEGYAGHWVCRFQSSYPPKCFSRAIGYAASQQLTDPTSIRRGFYLSINGSVEGNGEMTSNSGVYLNLDLISLEGFGPEIVSGPDAAAAFGNAAPALPAGASTVPVMPAAGAPVGVPAVGMTVAPPAAPVPVAVAPAPTPTAAPTPYAGYMTPGAPAVPPAAAPSVAPPPMVSPAAAATTSPGKVMTAAANGIAYDAYIAQGWTDELLVQHGMMVLA